MRPFPCEGSVEVEGLELEAPPGFEPGVEVLQTSALPLGDGADREHELSGEQRVRSATDAPYEALRRTTCVWPANRSPLARAKVGAGNGIRTRDFDLGKVALYH